MADASVYGTLKRLESAQQLATRLEPSGNGPPRKYYRLTTAGRHELTLLRRQWLAICAAIDQLGGGYASDT